MAKKKGKSGSVASVLFAVALLLASLTFAKVAGYLTDPARAGNVAASLAAAAEPNGAVVQTHVEKNKETVETLKTTNLFAKPAPKEHPVKQVDGIFGNEILVGNKWYKVGDTIGDAKIIEIKATEAMIEWDGKTKSFAPMVAAGNGSSQPSNGSSRSTPSTGKASASLERQRQLAEATARMAAQARALETAQASADDDPLDWMGVELSDDVRDKIMMIWDQIPDEQREEAMSEWNRMSDSERQEALNEIANSPMPMR